MKVINERSREQTDATAGYVRRGRRRRLHRFRLRAGSKGTLQKQRGEGRCRFRRGSRGTGVGLSDSGAENQTGCSSRQRIKAFTTSARLPELCKESGVARPSSLSLVPMRKNLASNTSMFRTLPWAALIGIRPAFPRLLPLLGISPRLWPGLLRPSGVTSRDR